MVLRTYSSPSLGQRPQRLGVIDPDPADHPVHGFGEAGQHEAVVASGRVPGDAVPSSTATDQPRRAISRAVVSPARPPPITQTSTSRSKVSGPRADAGTMVAAVPGRRVGARSDALTFIPRLQARARARSRHLEQFLAIRRDAGRMIVAELRLARHALRCQTAARRLRSPCACCCCDTPSPRRPSRACPITRAPQCARPRRCAGHRRLPGAPWARARPRDRLDRAAHARDLGAPRARRSRAAPAP